MKSDEKKVLLAHFSDKTRKPAIVGKKAILPKLFEEDGELRTTWSTPEASYKLTFAQLHFLKTYETTNDLDKACAAARRTADWGREFLAKHQASGGYLWEREKIRQLSTVATPEWTKAKAVEGVMGTWNPENPKVAVECLKIVKDINYPKAAININNNTILQMPTMDPEDEAALRALADRLANSVDTEAQQVA